MAVLLLATVVLTATAAARSFEYDEAYSVFVTSPVPRPDWPAGVFRAGDARTAFTRHAGPAAIAQALRATDVHPPLYFWALGLWRALAGDGLLAMRLLSVLFAVAALAAVGAIAMEVGVSAPMAMLLTLGCYGFAYTGSVARGFALAQALTLWGVLLIVQATTRSSGGGRRGLGGGVLLGAATLANYLAAFVGCAAVVWLAIVRRRERPAWLAAGLGFAAALPADLWFFIAQRASRVGQFPPFHLGPAFARLARFMVANLAGALPLYVPSSARLPLEATIAAGCIGLGLLVGRRWRCIARPDGRLLLLMGALAPPLGVLLLGAVFDTTPIELRYLCFAMPFCGLLMAGGASLQPVTSAKAGAHRARARMVAWVPAFAGMTKGKLGSGRALLCALLLVQSLSVAGLALRPETMQPARRLAREAARLAGKDGVILLPRGDDGVGVVGPFLAELPDAARVLLVADDEGPSEVCARLPPSPVVLARIAVDRASRTEVETAETAMHQCRDDRYAATAAASPADSR